MSYNANVSVNGSFVIAGTISSPLGKIIPNVIISFSVLPGANSYKIKPSKNNDVNKANVVSTLDIALVQSHILQKTIFNSPYKIIAADVNNDGKVSTLDIVYLKRLILGIDTTFAGNRLWAFVDSTAVLSATSPFPYKDSFSYANITATQNNQNFIGVKLGDVNFDWNAALPKVNQQDQVTLYYDSKLAVQNQEVRIPIRVKNFNKLLGLQYTMTYNQQHYKLINIANNTLGIEYAAHKDGKVSFLWNDAKNEVKTLNDGTVIFELVFVKTDNENIENTLDLNSTITAIEAWDENYQLHNVVLEKLSIKDPIVSAKESWLFIPNPSDGYIKVAVVANSNKVLQFILTNTNGKVLMLQNKEVIKGDNNFTVNLQQTSHLPTGIYFLKVEGLEADKVKQVFIK